MSIPASYAADFGIIVALYGCKALLFRSVRSSSHLLGSFFLAIALAVPMTWLTSPDWNNPHVYHIAIWVGDPIAVLAVPCASFLFDYFRGRRDMGHWPIRVPVEIFVGVPAWVYTWTMIQVFVFGWVWI